MEIVTVRFTNDVMWDNWGRLVTAFRKGDVVEVERHAGYYSAESLYWPGVTDLVFPEDFEVL